MTNNSGTFYFRITARTNLQEEYWRSNIMYGHSVDNLAPLPPGDFYAVMLGEDVKLGWQANTEPDLKHYEVYKSSENPPQDLVLVGVTTDTVLIDTSPDMNYYFVAAVDIHDNQSDFSVDNVQQSVNYIIMGYWNMLSLPLDVQDAHYQTLFPNSIEGTLYTWNGIYENKDTMKTGSGYWLRFSAADVVNIAGIGVNTIDIDLIAGWNMIGGVNCSIPLASVVDPGGIIVPGTLYEWTGTYIPSETIDAGKGYWVRTNAVGTITVDCQAEKMLAKVEGGGIGGKLIDIDEFSRIEVEDNEGISQTVYFGGKLEEGVSIESYSLPPIPPQGLFDVRLTGGYRLSESEEVTIELQSSNYPLRVKIEGKGGEYIVVQLKDEEETEERRVMSGEELTITNNKVNKLHITRGSLIPTEFTLYQNYPNPFNPSTTIKFAVAKESNVNLSIYNVLGELVTTLVNKQMKAGYYEYELNASNLASGVYLYRIQAGSFVETKKMVLMK